MVVGGKRAGGIFIINMCNVYPETDKEVLLAATTSSLDRPNACRMFLRSCGEPKRDKSGADKVEKADKDPLFRPVFEVGLNEG